MTKAAELRDLSRRGSPRQGEASSTIRCFRLRLQKAMGQLESPIKVRTTRRELARIKTIIRQKEQA